MANTFSPSVDHGGQADDIFLDGLPVGSSVTVVGAGAFGGWSALYLHRLGYEVTLVDAWGAGHSRASSGGDSRLMRCIYGENMFYTRLAARAYELWLEGEGEIGQQLLLPTGCLWFMDDSQKPLMQSAINILDQVGLQYEHLSPDDCQRRFPMVDTTGLTKIILERRTGVLLARESCRLVAEQLVKEGGTYQREYISPQSLVSRSNATDAYVFACGPWMKELFPDLLGAKLKVTRQEIYYFSVPAACQMQVETMPTWIDHKPPDHYYGVPFARSRGFKIAFDRRGPEVEPTTMERIPTRTEIEKARSYLDVRFPALAGASLIESRVCQYSNTETANLFFGQHPTDPSIYLLGGGSGHGFKHGPAVGELVAQCLTGNRAVPYQLSL